MVQNLPQRCADCGAESVYTICSTLESLPVDNAQIKEPSDLPFYDKKCPIECIPKRTSFY